MRAAPGDRICQIFFGAVSETFYQSCELLVQQVVVVSMVIRKRGKVDGREEW
jgi:hypothetical protein